MNSPSIPESPNDGRKMVFDMLAQWRIFEHKVNDAIDQSYAEELVTGIFEKKQTPTAEDFLRGGAESMLSLQNLEDYWATTESNLSHSRHMQAMKDWVQANTGNITEPQRVSLLKLAETTLEQDQKNWRERQSNSFDEAKKLFKGVRPKDDEDKAIWEKEWRKGHDLKGKMQQYAQMSHQDCSDLLEGALAQEWLSEEDRVSLEEMKIRWKGDKSESTKMMLKMEFFNYIQHRKNGVAALLKEIEGPFIVSLRDGKTMKVSSGEEFLKKVTPPRDTFSAERRREFELGNVQAIQTPFERELSHVVDEAQSGNFKFKGETSRAGSYQNIGEFIGAIENRDKPKERLRWNAINAQLKRLSPEFDLAKEASIVYVREGLGGYPVQRFVFELKAAETDSESEQDKRYLLVDLPGPRGYANVSLSFYAGDLKDLIENTKYIEDLDQQDPVTLSEKRLQDFQKNSLEIEKRVYAKRIQEASETTER